MTEYSANLEVRGYTLLVIFEHEPEVPGKFDGAPEDCYPEEPEEIDVLEMYFTGEEKLNFTELCSDDFKAEIDEACSNWVAERKNEERL